MCADASDAGSRIGRGILHGPSLEEVDGDRDNNMDFMRFTAASMVIYAHAFNLVGLDDPLESVTGMSSGLLAVSIFFVLSGYLISRSLINRPSLFEFVLARGLRILPALVVANVLAVICGAMFWTSLAQDEYWSSGSVWRYLVVNSSLLTNSYELPGVFQTNPYGPEVNGSLWTLPVEARMYAIVLLAGLLAALLPGIGRMGRTGWIVVLGAVGIALSAGAWRALGLPFSRLLFSEHGVHLLGIFSVGMVLQGVRDRVRLNGWIVLVGLGSCFLLRDTAFWYLAFMIALPYACLWFAYSGRIQARGFGRYGDMSYGIYVYAFPVQQWLYSSNPDLDPLWNASATFVIVLGLAFISWRLVEKPSLALKKSLHKRINRIRRDGGPGIPDEKNARPLAPDDGAIR